MQKLPGADLTKNLVALFCRHRRGWCGHIRMNPGRRNPPEGRDKPNMSEYTAEQIQALKEASDAITGVIRGLTTAIDGNTTIQSELAAGVQPPKGTKPPQPLPPPPPPPALKLIKRQAAALLKAAAILENAFPQTKR